MHTNQKRKPTHQKKLPTPQSRQLLLQHTEPRHPTQRTRHRTTPLRLTTQTSPHTLSQRQVQRRHQIGNQTTNTTQGHTRTRRPRQVPTHQVHLQQQNMRRNNQTQNRGTNTRKLPSTTQTIRRVQHKSNQTAAIERAISRSSRVNLHSRIKTS